MMSRWFCALLLCVAAVHPCLADEAQSGTVTGILAAKGENWIEVKADEAAESVKYTPFWRGGADGGWDKAMLETIKKLVVPNRVKLQWQMQERPRIVSVQMLVPEEKSGTITGVVTAKGERWIDVKPEDGGPVRFWPRWIGNASGGFDKDILSIFAGLKIGDSVSVTWKYDERMRALQVQASQ